MAGEEGPRNIDQLDESGATIADTDRLSIAPQGSSRMQRATLAKIKAWILAQLGVRFLPAGGTTGQVLEKLSNTDYAVQWAAPGQGPVTATGTPTARTLPDRFGEFVNLKDFGAAGDGGTDDRSELDAAITGAALKGASVIIPPGVYRIGSNLTVSVPLAFAQGARLKPDIGVNVDLQGGYSAGDYDHVFDISAGGTVTGTRSMRGYVTPQHFGATAAGTSHDDTPAIQAAIRFGALAVVRDEYASSLRVVFPLSPAATITATTGFYYVTSDIIVNRNVIIEGAGPPNRSLGSVMIRGAATCKAIFFCMHPGGLSAPEPYASETAALGAFGAGRPVIRNLALEPISATAKTIPAADFDPVTDTITLTNHGYPTGRAVEFTSSGAGVGPGGLVADRVYYVINTGANTFKLATTPAKATAGTAVDITSTGDATRTNRTEAIGMVDYGIVHNLPVTFSHVECKGFLKAGIFAHGQSSGNSAYGDPNGAPGVGTMFGNTNGSLYEKCVCRDSVRGHGMAAQGNNTQIMEYDTPDVSGNAGSGIYDNSSIGNVIVNGHSAQNAFKVLHGGTYYIALKTHVAAADSEPGVGANWRSYWWPVTATVADSDWTIGEDYLACAGINVVDAGASTAIYAHYTEGGIEAGIVPRSGTSIFGGEAVALGRVVRHGEFGNCQVFGGLLSNTPANWQNIDAAGDTYGSALSTTSFPTVPDLFAFGHSDDDAVGPTTIWKLTWSSIRNAYEWNRNASRKMSFTGTGYNSGGYTTAGLIVFDEGLVIGGPSTSNKGRIRYVANNAAISGTVVRGEIFFYSQPVAGGPVGAIVTTAGVVGSTAVVTEFGGAAALPTGAIIDSGFAAYTAFTALSTVIPADDTIPQNTEGTEILSVAITPKSTTSKLRCRFRGIAITETTAANVCVAAFRNSIADAEAAALVSPSGDGFPTLISLEWEVSPASTSLQTIKVRAGPGETGSIKFNGASARFFGGVQAATLVVEEIKA